jgi:hypothetical protein
MAKGGKGGYPGNQNQSGNKNSTNNKSNTNYSKSPPSNSVNQEIINQEKADTLLSQAREHIDEDELKASSDSSTPENFNSQELWHKAQIFDNATKQLESKIKKIETQQKDLETEKSQLQTKLSSLEQDRQNIDQEQKQIKERFVELIKNEEQVRKRELNAELGFIAQNQAVLQQFDHQVQEFRQELSQLYEIIATEKRKLAEEIAQKRKSLEQELEDERQKIEHQQQQITEDRKKVKFEQRKLQADKELFEEEKQFQDEKIEQISAARVERLEVKIKILEGQLQEARQIREQFQTKLMQRAEADRRFGQRTPDEVLAELEASRRLNDELEQKLSERPTEEAANQLSDLLIQQEEWETQRSQLKMQMEEQKRKAAMNQIAVLELETLRSQKEALEICINRLQESLRELRKQEEDAIGESKNRSPFERCAFMDQHVQLQSITRTTQETINLEDFAKDLRYRIALLDSTQGKHLYYSDRDIRAFLGGIAMSKLHILQGISGTGKTSLPIAFARSLGRAGGKNFKVIEVQAGWRDRQDLIGYFNSFEGRFYETEFLTALYEAQCPEFKDQIYIIILDEMNLSRPEQYFADFLSKLEQDDPLLTLNTDLKRPSPTLFREINTLAIPPNVWFVGTANQDETTLEFAKKTYDRAHIMELERNHPNFTLDYTPSPRYPISYKTLKTAFEDAQKNHAKAADRAFQFFKNDLEKLLGERFKVSWGNRLQRQMNHFIPVVLAAGGSLTEATDHILATKILRQIRDRHDIQAGDLRELQETIETYWSALDSGEPEKSLAIIQEELRQHDR